MKKSYFFKVLSAGVISAVFCASPAPALQETKGSVKDPRIKYADYRADEVFPILTKEGFVTTISFEKGEEVTSYGFRLFNCLGDSNRRKSVLSEAEAAGRRNQFHYRDRQTRLFL